MMSKSLLDSGMVSSDADKNDRITIAQGEHITESKYGQIAIV